MNLLFSQILNHKEAAALPSLRESGGLPALVSGLSPVHRANLAAALHGALGLPLFAVCADDTAAETFARDLAAMTGEEVAVLGMRDYVFYPAEAASRQSEQKRLAALYRLAKGESALTVASVSGLMQRTLPPKALLQTAFTITDGASIPPEDVEDALLRCGYRRSPQVEGPGQFARRGGILDFFSPADREPVRIEFWGDDVDSMSFFDVQSQRRTERLEQCTVLPAVEALSALYPGGAAALAKEIERFADNYQKRRKTELAATLAANLRADAEKLENAVPLSDLDRYLPLLYGEASALDYIPAEAVVFLDQPGRCAERARAYEKQLSEDVGELMKVPCGEGYCHACFDGEYPTRIPETSEYNRFDYKISEGRKA